LDKLPATRAAYQNVLVNVVLPGPEPLFLNPTPKRFGVLPKPSRPRSETAMAKPTSVQPVDQLLPARKLIPFGLQHVLVMAASPITSVFLVSKALNLSAELTINLISATFLVCGIGSLLQSFGPWKVGARLPFVMVPGGAPIVLFLIIAQQTDLQTATGAVILTAIFYFILLPVF